MKVALLGRDWEDDEREFITENLGEIVPSVMSSGSDVIVGMSKLPGGSKYFVMERCFDRRRRRTWTEVSDTLAGAVEKALGVADESSSG